MESSILYVGNRQILDWFLSVRAFTDNLDLKVDIISETSIDDGYNHLFTTQIGIFIIDSDVEGAGEAVSMIKAEEMVCHTPILVINVDDSSETSKEFFLLGADQVISLKQIDEDFFFPVIRPLILTHLLITEKIEKNSGFQEKAISDFILLDLVKAYIPKTIWKVAQECAHMQKIKLPEEEREQTIVFGDIKGFTKMSQHLPPKTVIATLNEVYEVVTRHIYEHNGDVDKFVGDAFFGIFDSPTDAVRSMVLIQKELDAINQQRESCGTWGIQFRIGINTGPVIRGNVGGNNRFDNTLIGDTVNTASRLEQISPVGDVVISDVTRKLVGLDIPEEFSWTELLRGRDCEIKVFKVYEMLKDNKSFLECKSDSKKTEKEN